MVIGKRENVLCAAKDSLICKRSSDCFAARMGLCSNVRSSALDLELALLAQDLRDLANEDEEHEREEKAQMAKHWIDCGGV